jgi:hypothetical protein
MDKDLIYSKEVGLILNIHEQTINKMRKKGLLPPHSCPTPGRYCWRRADILLFAGCWPMSMKEYSRVMDLSKS